MCRGWLSLMTFKLMKRFLKSFLCPSINFINNRLQSLLQKHSCMIVNHQLVDCDLCWNGIYLFYEICLHAGKNKVQKAQNKFHLHSSVRLVLSLFWETAVFYWCCLFCKDDLSEKVTSEHRGSKGFIGGNRRGDCFCRYFFILKWFCGIEEENYSSNRDIFASVSCSSVLRAPKASDLRLYSFFAARSWFLPAASAAATSSRVISSILRFSRQSEGFSEAFDKFESDIFCAS